MFQGFLFACLSHLLSLEIWLVVLIPLAMLLATITAGIYLTQFVGKDHFCRIARLQLRSDQGPAGEGDERRESRGELGTATVSPYLWALGQ
jgi:hypothetical protein